MAKYVAKRFVSMLITLFLVATVTFFLMHAVPGQPFEITRETPDSVKEALYEQYGLNNCASHSRYFSDELDAQFL